jgi:hypothetical protein
MSYSFHRRANGQFGRNKLDNPFGGIQFNEAGIRVKCPTCAEEHCPLINSYTCHICGTQLNIRDHRVQP